MQALGTPAETVQTTHSAGELAKLAQGLKSPSATTRAETIDELAGLGPDALPAIEERLKQLASHRPPLEAALTAMTRFRKVQGSKRADDDVDLAAGIAPVLDQGRHKDVLRMAEPLLLLRSLEAMRTPEAGRVIVSRLFALEDKVWRWESQRTLRRLGAVLLPALWLNQTHKRAWVRRFCRWGIEKLGLRNPGLAVQQKDPAVLAAVLRAYGETLHFPAMPTIVSFVGSQRSQVRAAAREATERFGRNAIWQIREAYLNATGKDANPDWGHKRALEELYTWHDRPRRMAAEQAVADGTAALKAGKLDEAQDALHRALAIDPTGDVTASTGAAYAQLGERYLQREQLTQATRAYSRALRLSPGHNDAAKWQARLVFAEADRRLAEGVVDVEGYRQAAALDPSHVEAAAMVDQLSGARSERRNSWRKAAGFIAALLLAFASLLLLRSKPEALAASATDAQEA